VSKEDALLFQFLQKDFGDPFKGEAIEPDRVEYGAPDFGFNNRLIFDSAPPTPVEPGSYSGNWKYLMDYSSPFPKFERLKNYI